MRATFLAASDIGCGVSPISGSYAVSEFFAEASIPLLEGKTAAELVSLDVAYRYSDYSTDKQTDTYKFGGEWMLHPSVRFRASFQHAVRVGNIHELFQPLNDGGADGMDRCQGTIPEATFDQCRNTGVTAAQYGNIVDAEFEFFNTRFGGNPNLDPEESDTVSFGFILNPDFLPALTLSMDYFDIEISGAIAEPSAQFLMDECIESGTARFCDSIHRDPSTGLLWLGEAFVNVANTNIGFIQTSGIDIVATYEQEIGRFGDLDFDLVATYLDTWDWQELPGEPAFDCIGIYEAGPCIRPRYEYLSNLRTTWMTPWDASISMLWRHMSEVIDGTGNGNHLGSYDYIDLAGLWDVSEDVAIRVGINNVLDKDPPIASGFSSGNTKAEAYDALGRYWFTGFSVKF